MRDGHGIFRGYCIECTARQCPEYEKPIEGHLCAYCSCAPVKHEIQCQDPAFMERNGENNNADWFVNVFAKNSSKTLETDGYESQSLLRTHTSENNSSAHSPRNDSYESVSLLRTHTSENNSSAHSPLNDDYDSQSLLRTYPAENNSSAHSLRNDVENSHSLTLDSPMTVVRQNLHFPSAGTTSLTFDSECSGEPSHLPPFQETTNLNLKLPMFSVATANGLKCQPVPPHIWKSAIVQAANHYMNIGVSTQAHYAMIGEMMFHKYPSIQLNGNTPWQKFTKALSQKVRKERMRKKKEEIFTSCGAIKLSEFTTTKKKIIVTKEVIRYSRPLRNAVSRNREIELQEKITSEMAKKKIDFAVVKAILRESFQNRTDLMTDETLTPFRCLMNEYSFMADNILCFLYEMSILLGTPNFKVMEDNLTRFIGLLPKILNSKSKVKDEKDIFKLWSAFEKKVGFFQGRGEKSKHLIEIYESNEEFNRNIENPVIAPRAVVCLVEQNYKGWIVIEDKQIKLTNDQINLETILKVLLSVYYSLQIHFPACFLQQMGILSQWVLDENNYKLGLKSCKMNSTIKSFW